MFIYIRTKQLFPSRDREIRLSSSSRPRLDSYVVICFEHRSTSPPDFRLARLGKEDAPYQVIGPKRPRYRDSSILIGHYQWLQALCGKIGYFLSRHFIRHTQFFGHSHFLKQCFAYCKLHLLFYVNNSKHLHNTHTREVCVPNTRTRYRRFWRSERC